MTMKSRSIYILLLLLFLSSEGSSQGEIVYQPLYNIFKPQFVVRDSTFMKNSFVHGFTIFEVSELPIFCKNEYKWSKLSGVNVRMRIGSLDYVNMLENK